jgi:DnaJ-domain-containing protein 1
MPFKQHNCNAGLGAGVVRQLGRAWGSVSFIPDLIFICLCVQPFGRQASTHSPGIQTSDHCSSRDLYDVLKVDRSADEATIKRAYRKAAVRLHPDKVQGTDEEKKKAAEKFQELSHG